MNKNLIEYGGKIVVVTSTSVYKLISVYQLIYDKLLLRMLHCWEVPVLLSYIMKQKRWPFNTSNTPELTCYFSDPQPIMFTKNI